MQIEQNFTVELCLLYFWLSHLLALHDRPKQLFSVLAQSRKLKLNTRQLLGHSGAAPMQSLACCMFSSAPPSLYSFPATAHSGVWYQTSEALIDTILKDKDQGKLIAGMEKAHHLVAFCYLQAVFKLLNRQTLGVPGSRHELGGHQILFCHNTRTLPYIKQVNPGIIPSVRSPHASCSGDAKLCIPQLL